MHASETKLQFPKNFLMGAAASAHQVEGNNMNSDWWFWERKGKVPKSGDAADHYNRFDEDFQIAHDIGLNAMRISIEWARIEPAEGRWDAVAIEHYKKSSKIHEGAWVISHGHALALDVTAMVCRKRWI